MPKLVRYLRQRERVIENTWSPVHPGFLSYSYGGQLYGRTYADATVDFNDNEAGVSAFPIGFYFMPAPIPALVPISAETFLSTFDASGGGGLTGIPPAPIPIPTPTPSPPGGVALLASYDGIVACGLVSTPLKATSFQVLRVTILADPANSGTIWLSGSKNTPAGQGFKLVAGAAKDLGDVTSSKLLDLSGVYIIGTAATDQVFIEYEL